ncbi:MAG: ABC transporter substrate binding protein [Bacteroidota bacterium]
MKCFILSLLCLTIFSIQAIGQVGVQIAFVNEVKDGETDFFQELIRSEIQTLLKNRWKVEFREFHGEHDRETIREQLQLAFADQEVDVVIAVGPLSSSELVRQAQFPKPSIATLGLDKSLQGLPLNEEKASGIHNLVYLESPFDFQRDILKLHEVHPFKELAVVGGKNLLGDLDVLESIMKIHTDQLQVKTTLILVEDDVEKALESIPETVDAIYAMPLFDFSDSSRIQFFSSINKRGIPTAALLGESYIESGALLAYEADANIRRMPRRIALNVMKILEGVPAARIPVEMETYNENLLINMSTAREIGIYPTFEVMAEGTLINMNVVPEGRVISLQGVIAEALINNLDVKIAEIEPQIVGKDIALARADLLPKLDVSTILSAQDELSTFIQNGAQGRVNWIGSASVSQVFFAEPAFANIAVQKILQESANFELEQSRLDAILNVANAYLVVLQASSNLKIQQENVAVTKENYDIAKAKEAVGYSGATDINRWESELDVRNIDLNDAYAGLQQARFRLNQLLNRPIDEAFNLQDVSLENQMILIAGRRLELIDNYGDLEKFADFVVEEGMRRLPELKQIQAGIRVQERLKQSRQRAFYLPSLALSGSGNRIFDKYNVPEPLMPTENGITTWNLGLALSFPILKGDSRRQQLQQTQLSLAQLENQKSNAQNQFELAIRSNIETLGASFSRVRLYGGAAEASSKNFQIVQNAYSEGQANITTLIDAQNNALQVELASINAVYTFIMDFLTLERSMGFYFFALSQEERDAFFDRMNQFINE